MSGKANWLVGIAAARVKLVMNKLLNTCRLIGRHKQLNKLGVAKKNRAWGETPNAILNDAAVNRCKAHTYLHIDR